MLMLPGSEAQLRAGNDRRVTNIHYTSTPTMSTPVAVSSPSDGVLSKRKRCVYLPNYGTASSTFSRSLSLVDGPPSTRRRSASPRERRQDKPRVEDVDPVRRAERERQLAVRMAAVELEKIEKERGQTEEKDKFNAQAEFAKLIGTRSGGVYMPPARLRALQAAAAQDKSSPEYQRLAWDALRKSITGIVNRVNITNIKNIVPELFSENLIRGKGLFARSVMKAQATSLPFTPVFACLVSIINTKLPQVGELVLTRLISQFRRSFKRNDKVRVSLLLLLHYQVFTTSNRSCAVRQPLLLPTSSTSKWPTRSSLSRSLFCYLNALPTTRSR